MSEGSLKVSGVFVVLTCGRIFMPFGTFSKGEEVTIMFSSIIEKGKKTQCSTAAYMGFSAVYNEQSLGYMVVFFYPSVGHMCCGSRNNISGEVRKQSSLCGLRENNEIP